MLLKAMKQSKPMNKCVVMHDLSLCHLINPSYDCIVMHVVLLRVYCYYVKRLPQKTKFKEELIPIEEDEVSNLSFGFPAFPAPPWLVPS